MPEVKVLFDFHILIDTDFGTIKYIQSNKKLRKPAFFQERLLNLPDFKIIELLNLRPSYNPLDAIAVIDKRDKLDNIFNQLMTDPNIYKDILDKSKSTLLLKSYNLFNRMTDNKITSDILYYNETDLDYITNKLNIPAEDCIMYTPEMDISDYGTIYMMFYADTMKFNRESVQGKYIYIPDFEVNIDRLKVSNEDSELIPKQAVTQRLYPNNVVNIINIYQNKSAEENE